MLETLPGFPRSACAGDPQHLTQLLQRVASAPHRPAHGAEHVERGARRHSGLGGAVPWRHGGGRWQSGGLGRREGRLDDFPDLMTMEGRTCWTMENDLPSFNGILWEIPSGNLTVCELEHDHRNSDFSQQKLWFSIAMLNYQRVCPIVNVSMTIAEKTPFLDG